MTVSRERSAAQRRMCADGADQARLRAASQFVLELPRLSAVPAKYTRRSASRMRISRSRTKPGADQRQRRQRRAAAARSPAVAAGRGSAWRRPSERADQGASERLPAGARVPPRGQRAVDRFEHQPRRQCRQQCRQQQRGPQRRARSCTNRRRRDRRARAPRVMRSRRQLVTGQFDRRRWSARRRRRLAGSRARGPGCERRSDRLIASPPACFASACCSAGSRGSSRSARRYAASAVRWSPRASRCRRAARAARSSAARAAPRASVPRAPPHSRSSRAYAAATAYCVCIDQGSSCSAVLSFWSAFTGCLDTSPWPELLYSAATYWRPRLAATSAASSAECDHVACSRAARRAVLRRRAVLCVRLPRPARPGSPPRASPCRRARGCCRASRRWSRPARP